MKNFLCILATLALAPLAAQAQYNPSATGYEKVKSDIAVGEILSRTSENNARTAAPVRRGPMFRAPQYGRMFTGKSGPERRAIRAKKAEAKTNDGWVRYPGGYWGKDGQIRKPDGTIVGEKQ